MAATMNRMAYMWLVTREVVERLVEASAHGLREHCPPLPRIEVRL